MNHFQTISRFTATLASIFAIGAGSAGCALAGAEATADEQTELHPGPGVLPPGAAPHGTTLTHMARETAPFVTGGDDPADLPSTPFQVLYADWSTADVSVVPDGAGQRLLIQAGNHFDAVPAGTTFFVPIYYYDDSPPIYAPFPTSNQAARTAMFSPAGQGGVYSVKIDGQQEVSLGPDYVAGPVVVRPLPDGDGTHLVSVSAFVAPLPPGDHVVTVHGITSGALALAYNGGLPAEAVFSYHVHVME